MRKKLIGVMVVAVLLTAGVALPHLVAYADTGEREETEVTSPLYQVRVDQAEQAFAETPNVLTETAGGENSGDTVSPQWLPSLQPASLCLGSVCVGSVCLGSVCAGSVCLGSGCVGSGCLGSGCVGSGCGGSACVGSGCVGSVCVGSGCLGSVCAAPSTCAGMLNCL